VIPSSWTVDACRLPTAVHRWRSAPIFLPCRKKTFWVLLTPLTDQALSLDVLARLPGRRLIHLDRWELVRHAFGATHIDPRLPTQGWFAELLLGAVPGGGLAPAPSGWLDADTAWRILLQYYLKVDTGRPDAGISFTGVSTWSGCRDTGRSLSRFARE
jgi:hypothetical protein